MKYMLLLEKINKHEKAVNKFINALLILLLIMFVYVEIRKPLWLDEINSLIVITNDSPLLILKKLFFGSDTNAPLYFIILKIFSIFFGNDVVTLKILSITLTALTFIVINKILDFFEVGTLHKKFILSLIFVLPAVSTYILVEVRTYPLLFLLEATFIYYYFKFEKEKTFSSELFLLITAVALFYTHYFSFFFITPFLIISLFNFKEKKSFYLVLVLAFILFSPWLIAVYRQLQIGHGYTWQKIPTIKDIYYTYNFLFGKIGILLILLFLIIFWLKKKFSAFRNISLFLLSLLILGIPLVNLILSYFRISVHSPRYFIGTVFSLLLLLIFFVKNNLLKTKNILILLIVVGFWGAYRVVKVFPYSFQRIRLNEQYLNLNNGNYKIVCESALDFFPLTYYAKKEMNKSSFVYLLSDSLSLFQKKNCEKLKFDFFLIKDYIKYYHIKNVWNVNTFLELNKKFFLINSQDRRFFEHQFKNNKSFDITKIGNNIYFIEKK